jgi:hypothetical protein
VIKAILALKVRKVKLVPLVLKAHKVLLARPVPKVLKA